MALEGIAIASAEAMRAIDERPWRTGDRVRVRGRTWTILERVEFDDCEALRLEGLPRSTGASVRTILTPFDRPVRVQRSRSIAVVRPRRWLHSLRRAAVDARPYAGLTAAARAAIDLVPYQLEPALAVVGRGIARVLIADAVGLGKTIQAAIVLNELASRRAAFRALVVAPAGLREQWRHELAQRFGLASTVAGSAWLAQAARDLPAGVNPWMLPGIYVSSFDFIKQPEVLRPLEDALWDAVVVDEAHAATLGTARRAAVQAVALRSRRVILLSATPHAGDPAEFEALCAIGASGRLRDPLLLFRRSRADAGIDTPRRTALLTVRPSESEARMHRLLERYTDRVCREARLRGDGRARLAAIVLKKRALSSAASLMVSCRRRLMLLAGNAPAVEERQLQLPLDDRDSLNDEEPDSVLGAPGLADARLERRWLAAIAEAARHAARAESKTRFLARLLSRVTEPVIVFTEYRDTLERLRRALAPVRHDVAVLHGGLSPADRSAVQRAFNAHGSLLIATDAASEGLNLHGRCRAVLHYELPWSPARLEQRTGRVDRIGQSRIVHEILLVAGDTAERLVLAPLARRASRARARLPGSSRLIDLLSESRVAAAVMEGDPIEAPAAADHEPSERSPPAQLRAESVTEAARLRRCREWGTSAARPGRGDRVQACAVRGRIPPGLVCVYTLSLSTTDGAVVHEEIVAIHCEEALAAKPAFAGIRQLVSEFLRLREPFVRQALSERLRGHVARIETERAGAIALIAQRERTIAAIVHSSTRQLVQASLFDRRAVRAEAARARSAAGLLSALDESSAWRGSDGKLTAAFDVSAVLVAEGPSRR